MFARHHHRHGERAGDRREQQKEERRPVDRSSIATLLRCVRRASESASSSSPCRCCGFGGSARRSPANSRATRTPHAARSDSEERPVRQRILPQRRAQKRHRRDRHAVFQARRDHLVDPQPRQRPANPHHHRHADHALEQDVDAAEHVAERSPTQEPCVERQPEPARQSGSARASRRGTGSTPAGSRPSSSRTRP